MGDVGKPRKGRSWGSLQLVVLLILTSSCSPWGPTLGARGRGATLPRNSSLDQRQRLQLLPDLMWLWPSPLCCSPHHFLSLGLFVIPSVSISVGLPSVPLVHRFPEHKGQGTHNC